MPTLMIFKIKSCIFIAHGIYFLLYKLCSFYIYLLNEHCQVPRSAPGRTLLSFTNFWRTQVRQAVGPSYSLDIHQNQHQSQTSMLSHGNSFVVRWSHSQDGGAGALVLVGKCRKVDSWLGGNVLCLLILLFLREIQICCSLAQFHHLIDYLLSHLHSQLLFFLSLLFLYLSLSALISPFLSLPSTACSLSLLYAP